MTSRTPRMTRIRFVAFFFFLAMDAGEWFENVKGLQVVPDQEGCTQLKSDCPGSRIPW